MTKINTKTTQERIAVLEAKMIAIEKENTELRRLVDFHICDVSKTQGEVSVYSDWIKDMRERLDAVEKRHAKKKKPKEGWAVNLTSEEMKEVEREWRIGS